MAVLKCVSIQKDISCNGPAIHTHEQMQGIVVWSNEIFVFVTKSLVYFTAGANRTTPEIIRQIPTCTKLEAGIGKNIISFSHWIGPDDANSAAQTLSTLLLAFAKISLLRSRSRTPPNLLINI